LLKTKNPAKSGVFILYLFVLITLQQLRHLQPELLPQQQLPQPEQQQELQHRYEYVLFSQEPEQELRQW
jgi:hypothetical protein